MKPISDTPILRRVLHPRANSYGDPYNGAAYVRIGGRTFTVLFSDGDGWDHVSVSLQDRCPTWDEMCRIKALFFDPEDCVVQYHPPESVYRNAHAFCLHLWRWQGGTFPMPDADMVA